MAGTKNTDNLLNLVNVPMCSPPPPNQHPPLPPTEMVTYPLREKKEGAREGFCWLPKPQNTSFLFGFFLSVCTAAVFFCGADTPAPSPAQPLPPHFVRSSLLPLRPSMASADSSLPTVATVAVLAVSTLAVAYALSRPTQMVRCPHCWPVFLAVAPSMESPQGSHLAVRI